MSIDDLYLLSPEISLAAVAVMVVLVDLLNGRKSQMSTVAVVGLAIPLFLPFYSGEKSQTGGASLGPR